MPRPKLEGPVSQSSEQVPGISCRGPEEFRASLGNLNTRSNFRMESANQPSGARTRQQAILCWGAQRECRKCQVACQVRSGAGG